MSERARTAAAAALVALVAFLPFLRGALSGASLYFRDLSLHFFPLRRFALEGLRAGELRLWNPYVHEGVPLSLPALGYPARPAGPALAERGVPLAAAGPSRSARRALLLPAGARAGARPRGGLRWRARLRAGRVLPLDRQSLRLPPGGGVGAASGAGPRAAARGRGQRALAGAALAVAVALSTTGVEIVAQAIVAGVLLGLLRAAVRCAPPGASPPRSALGSGARRARAGAGRGPAGRQRARRRASRPTWSSPTRSTPSLSSRPSSAASSATPRTSPTSGGARTSSRAAFPYVLSLYLGASVLALAVAGAADRRAPREGCWLYSPSVSSSRSDAGEGSPRSSRPPRGCASSASR